MTLCSYPLSSTITQTHPSVRPHKIQRGQLPPDIPIASMHLWAVCPVWAVYPGLHSVHSAIHSNNWRGRNLKAPPDLTQVLQLDSGSGVHTASTRAHALRAGAIRRACY